MAMSKNDVLEAISSMSVLDLSELIKEMFDCDAGILRLGGEATTGTTKIFDYIACDLDIIIITDGKLKEGAVHDLTDGLEGIFWIKNNPDALQSFINSYEPTRSKGKKEKEKKWKRGKEEKRKRRKEEIQKIQIQIQFVSNCHFSRG